MPWFGKKKDKIDRDPKGDRVTKTVQRRSVSGVSSSSSSTVTKTFYHSSETVRHIGSQRQQTGKIPSTSSALSSSDRFSFDARPFVPTTIIPNYKSPLQRNRPYNSVRSISYVPNTSTSPSTEGAVSVISPSSQSLTRNNSPSTQTNANNTTVLDRYQTDSKKRGNVLIINNIKFMGENNERKGAILDEENAYKLFKDMGFDVEKHRDLKLSAMQDKIKAFRKNVKGDISIVIIMSHGTNKDNNNIPVSGSFTQIISADGRCLDTEDVVAEFSAEKCRAMKGKPKIFIFQCCRGDEEELQVDHISGKKCVKKDHADMLIAFSTLPNFYSVRDTKKGSWYIQCICEIFRKHAKHMDVEHLLKLVDMKMSQMHESRVQTSTYESRGFNKQCYLNPKW